MCIPKKSCYAENHVMYLSCCDLGRLEAISSSTDEEKNEGSLNVWLMPDNWMEDPWTRVCTYHITTLHILYTYIDSLSTYFENNLLPQFVSQGCFSWLSSQWPAQAAVKDKSWTETIFKIISATICSKLEF